ncbi:MAG: hypothetical protein AB1689_25440 [Thermodesulfobacteriota bacterium]
MSRVPEADRRDAIRWLRASCWAGAILDALAAASMLSPRLFAAQNGLEGFQPGPEYRYAMGMGASLMLGWTVLLLWADRRPLERSGVLLITLVPVVAGLVANEVLAVRTGFLPVATIAPVWVVQGLLSVLFAASYAKARSLGPEPRR